MSASPEKKRKRSLPHIVQRAVAGGIAGAVSRTAVAPLERLKILFQTQSDPPKYRGVLHAVSVITSEEGVSGLWRGNYANCFRIIPKTAVQYASFGLWKPAFDQLLGDVTSSGSMGKLLSAGMAAGLSAQIASYPFDTVRARLTVDSTSKLNGVFTTMYNIIKYEGFSSLYKGIIPTLCGSVPYVGIEFMVYGTLKQTTLLPKKPGTNELTVVGKLCCGACGAMVGQTITYPFDLVRRRMQVAGYSSEMRRYKGLLDAIVTIARTEGFTAFYKGLVPNYMKSVPAVAITWAVYEEAISLLGKFHY